MPRLYLITGFLGAGKTTFLREFLSCFPHQKIALVINEFGKEGVDGALLASLSLALSEIDNGSIFCACRAEQFRQTLVATLANQPDVVVVEASGLSDPTDMKTLMAQPEFAQVEYRGAICLVDAFRFHKVYATARVCKKQLAVADAVVINKIDLATAEQLEEIRREIAALRPGVLVLETSFGRISPEWLSTLTAPARQPGTVLPRVKDITLQKRTLVIPAAVPAETIRHFLTMFCEDTYRVKGFFQTEGKVWLADCVGPAVCVTPWEGSAPHLGRLTVLFGNGLPAVSSIQKAIEWYQQYPITLEQEG